MPSIINISPNTFLRTQHNIYYAHVSMKQRSIDSKKRLQLTATKDQFGSKFIGIFGFQISFIGIFQVSQECHVYMPNHFKLVHKKYKLPPQ
jgi:hypothetical protein